LTCGRIHIRTLTVMSPRRTPSRNLFVKTMVSGPVSLDRLSPDRAADQEGHELCSTKGTAADDADCADRSEISMPHPRNPCHPRLKFLRNWAEPMRKCNVMQIEKRRLNEHDESSYQ
jgi:hypothetical protein